MRKRSYVKRGRDLLNKIIDKTPIEIHLPGYNWCGPGTKVNKRLGRGDTGVNPLDEACKEHDIVYENSKSSEVRKNADIRLKEKAWERLKAKDSTIGENIAAAVVGAAMKLKSGGCFKALLKKIRKSLVKGASIKDNIKKALKIARKYVKTSGRKKIKAPRVIPIPQTGGVLPLIPIVTALSAVGGLAGGVSNIVKNIMDTKATYKRLEEEKRHNMALERNQKQGAGIYLQKYKKPIMNALSGSGAYLRPYKRSPVGSGAYLQPFRKGLGLYLNGTDEGRVGKKKNSPYL